MIDGFILMFVMNTIQHFLWGFYTCIFIVTLYVMRARKATFTPALIAIVLLYMFNFTSTILQTYMTLPAISQYTVTPVINWTNISTDTLNGMNDMMLFFSIWVADCTVAWRLWIVWSKDYRVLAFPALALLSGVVGGTFLITWDCKGIINYPHYEALSEAMLSLTAIMNVYITCMTVGRLWWVSSRVKNICSARQTSSRYQTFIFAVIESGIAYTLATIIFTVLLHVSLEARLIFQGFFFYTIGIAPTLILLKLSLGYLQPSDSVVGSGPSHQSALTAPQRSKVRRDDLSCDLSDLESRGDMSSVSRLGEKADLDSPLEGRNSNGGVQIYVDTNNHMV